MSDEEKIRAWCREVSYVDRDNRLVGRLRRWLPDAGVVRVLEALADTCHHCYDAPAGCQCWNDD
jgi:hypothetical protein